MAVKFKYSTWHLRRNKIETQKAGVPRCTNGMKLNAVIELSVCSALMTLILVQ